MCKEEELTVHDMCEKCKSIIRKHEYGYILSEMEEKENKIYPYQTVSVTTDNNGETHILIEPNPVLSDVSEK